MTSGNTLIYSGILNLKDWKSHRNNKILVLAIVTKYSKRSVSSEELIIQTKRVVSVYVIEKYVTSNSH